MWGEKQEMVIKCITEEFGNNGRFHPGNVG